MSRYKDTFLGAAVILISAVLFYASFHIQEFTRISMGAGFVPRVTAVIFCILGIILIVRNLRSPAPAPAAAPGPKATGVGLTGLLPVVLNIILFIAYLLLLEKIGFMILTPVYIFLQILLLTNPAKYRLGWYAGLSIVVGVVSYYLFVNFFQVMLPNGILS